MKYKVKFLSTDRNLIGVLCMLCLKIFSFIHMVHSLIFNSETTALNPMSKPYLSKTPIFSIILMTAFLLFGIQDSASSPWLESISNREITNKNYKNAKTKWPWVDLKENICLQYENSNKMTKCFLVGLHLRKCTLSGSNFWLLWSCLQMTTKVQQVLIGELELNFNK